MEESTSTLELSYDDQTDENFNETIIYKYALYPNVHLYLHRVAHTLNPAPLTFISYTMIPQSTRA